MRIPVLLVTCVLGATSAADKPRKPRPAANATAWCEQASTDRFEVTRDGWRRVVDGKPEQKLLTVEWRGRLDPDRRLDVVLDEGECGTRECIHGIYVQCPDGSYASVFTGYAARVKVSPRKRGWSVVSIEHVGELDEYGHRPREWSRMTFGAGGYQ
jgi:hypothetical protein